MPEVPEWRLDDLAAYDAMRESAATVASRLALSGGVTEASVILKDALSVDPFARADVDETVRRMTDAAAGR